jgi:hypothetical protein
MSETGSTTGWGLAVVCRDRTPPDTRAFVPRNAGFSSPPSSPYRSPRDENSVFTRPSLHRKIPFLTRMSETGSTMGWGWQFGPFQPHHPVLPNRRFSGRVKTGRFCGDFRRYLSAIAVSGDRCAHRRIYFGRIVGSPPGLPGGGMTGILPVSGVGARISGSTPVGGQSTPSDFASLSLSGSACGSVVVVPCGAMVPCCGIDCVGAQPVAFLAGAGGAV